MTGVILAGGKGDRLKPLTDDKPKVMLEIGGRPVIDYNVNLLKEAGISDVIITLYHKSGAVTGYFKDGAGRGIKIAYSLQDALKGTAGDLKSVKREFASAFTLVYGDNFSNCALKTVIGYHSKNKGIATIVLFDRDINPNSGIAGGCVDIDRETGRIRKFTEGKGVLTGYVNAGIYVLDPAILGEIPANTVYDFGRDLFPALIEKGQAIYGYIMPPDEYLFGIDNMECYETTKKFYEKKLKGART